MTVKETVHKNVLTPTNRNVYKDILCSLYYDSDRKRYWTSIMPCSKSDWAMECTLFDGKSEIVLRVENRRSKKSDAQAIEIFDAAQTRYLELFIPPTPPAELTTDQIIATVQAVVDESFNNLQTQLFAD